MRSFLPVVGLLTALTTPSLALADTNEDGKASPDWSIGAMVMATYFDDLMNFCFGSECSGISELEDDEDFGFEIFAKASYSPLWTWKFGYMDYGEFTYSARSAVTDALGKADVSLAYAAWAPQWQVTDAFAFTFGLGLGAQFVDDDNPEGSKGLEDDLGSYTTLGAEYRFTQNFALHLEAGYSLGEDIDVGWLGAGGSYYF